MEKYSNVSTFELIFGKKDNAWVKEAEEFAKKWEEDGQFDGSQDAKEEVAYNIWLKHKDEILTSEQHVRKLIERYQEHMKENHGYYVEDSTYLNVMDKQRELIKWLDLGNDPTTEKGAKHFRRELQDIPDWWFQEQRYEPELDEEFREVVLKLLPLMEWVGV